MNGRSTESEGGQAKAQVLAQASHVTTHVLDLATGQPAAGMEVLLERVAGAGQIEAIARGTTDANGRITELGPQQLTPGAYRLRFDAGGYQGERGFYAEIAITFRLDDPSQHYHVPLLLGPWGYTTYRGS